MIFSLEKACLGLPPQISGDSLVFGFTFNKKIKGRHSVYGLVCCKLMLNEERVSPTLDEMLRNQCGSKGAAGSF